MRNFKGVILILLLLINCFRASLVEGAENEYLDIISSERTGKINADPNFCRDENIDIRECICSTHQLVPVVKPGRQDKVHDEVNSIIQSKVQDITAECEQMPFVQEVTYNTTINTRDLLSVEFQYYIYYNNAAHPTHLKDYIVYDLKLHKEIVFEEVVDKEHYKALSDYVRKYVKDVGIKCNLEDPIQPNARFFFDAKNKKLYVHIDTADWAYACGGVNVPVPKQYIKHPLIKSMYEY